jgi:hypothetical protein
MIVEHTKMGVFFLSTGRCGTQWLQKALTATYPNEAVVTHEPVRGAYAPKSYLRAYDRLDEILSLKEVSEHLSFIRKALKSKMYVETGWPCYPALPLIIDQLNGRARIVHLVRHPVYVALSLAAHRVYDERQDWISGAAISPFDPGVVHKVLAGDWAQMGAYEKCLFWWTEINLYALELKERLSNVKFTVVRYEDLFDPGAQTLKDLIRFMGFPYDSSLSAFRLKNVDQFQWKAPPADWKLIFRYPQTLALAEQFGYDFDGLSEPNIEARYFDNRQERTGGKWRRLMQNIQKFGLSD